jgi:hypothetical protein
MAGIIVCHQNVAFFPEFLLAVWAVTGLIGA